MRVPPSSHCVAWKMTAGRSVGQTHITRRAFRHGEKNTTVCGKPVPTDAHDYEESGNGVCARCFDAYEQGK